MSSFRDHYDSLRFPLETEERAGLRRPQRGALFALGAHFSRSADPAVIAMPTGSGKTAVLMAAPYVLEAERVLVITPSRLVRGQIAERFGSLSILREVGAIGKGVPDPLTTEVTARLTTAEQWEALREFEVVVATPGSVSPGLREVVSPPADLFDLLLVDEAHHSPARTWNRLLQSFPSAKRALFTATPFRADRREIQGRFVYSYSTKQAFEDGVFGQVTYNAVRPREGESADVAVARETEEALQSDRADGLNHRVIVRTDTKVRAEELRGVYENTTDLKLQMIHSGHSTRHVRSVLGKLTRGELDGLICVDMLGEGFDFPHLKIAAIHAPHKSLAVTLQFIGRFARTNAPDIGAATFLAVPDDITIEARRLYEEGAVWEEIVLELGDDRIDQEIEIRESLDTFHVVKAGPEEVADLSLYSLEPAQHVKIYRVWDAVDIQRPVHSLRSLETLHHDVSEDLGAAVLVTKEALQPRWSDATQFARVQYDLFVVVSCPDDGLLFLCASRRSVAIYEELASVYTNGAHNILPLNELNRVLDGFEDLSFWNVGMRSRVRTPKTESYRIVAGTGVDNAITPTDGRLFHRGHCFGGSAGDGASTIGLSSSSKVWSMGSVQIPQLVEWCHELAAKITADVEVVTGSGLDHLQMDRTITELPAPVIGVDWTGSTYANPNRLIRIDGGAWCPLVRASLELLSVGATEAPVSVELSLFEQTAVLHYDVTGTPTWTTADTVEVSDGDAPFELDLLLQEEPLQLFLSDFSSVVGRSYLPLPTGGLHVPAEVWQTEDWIEHGVDIEREFGDTGTQFVSIQDRVRAVLLASPANCVILDHGTGEVADLITITIVDDIAEVTLYHCKGANGAAPGSRVGDVYDVSGQVVRSARWVGRFSHLLSELQRRTTDVATSSILRGADVLEAQIAEPALEWRLEVVLVQPGVSRSGVEENVGDVLAAAVGFAKSCGINKTTVWCSP